MFAPLCTYVPADFTELEAACCGGGPYGAAFACNETAPVCANRDDYLFWDANHPSQAVSAIAAQTIFAGNQTFVGHQRQGARNAVILRNFLGFLKTLCS